MAIASNRSPASADAEGLVGGVTEEGVAAGDRLVLGSDGAVGGAGCEDTA